MNLPTLADARTALDIEAVRRTRATKPVEQFQRGLLTVDDLILALAQIDTVETLNDLRVGYGITPSSTRRDYSFVQLDWATDDLPDPARDPLADARHVALRFTYLDAIGVVEDSGPGGWPIIEFVGTTDSIYALVTWYDGNAPTLHRNPSARPSRRASSQSASCPLRRRPARPSPVRSASTFLVAA